MAFLTLEMTSNVVDSDTVESAVLNPIYWSRACFCSPSRSHLDLKTGKHKQKSGNFVLDIWPFDLEDDLRCYWKWLYRTRRPRKLRYRYRDRISSPSRSHFSPGLKLILQTQVTNSEHRRFQSFSKGVYARQSQSQWGTVVPTLL